MHRLWQPAAFATVVMFGFCDARLVQAQPPGKNNGQKRAPEANQSLPERLKSAGIQCIEGPAKGKINSGGASESLADITIPAGHVFLEGHNAAKFAAATDNEGGERWGGVLFLPGGNGFLVFDFQPIGYIQDADKEKIDADGLLKTLKEGNRLHNEQRKKMGKKPVELIGWEVPPYYDADTKNLTWAKKLQDADGITINHDVRMLGRKGVMEVTLVCGPDNYPVAKNLVNPLLKGYTFTKGNSYGEFTSGDKIAAYGLAGLIAGGGVALAAKTGLLAMLAKNVKWVVLVVIGAGAAIFKGIGAIFGGRRRD